MPRPLLRVLLVALAASSPDAPLVRSSSSCPVASSSEPPSFPSALAANVSALRSAHGADPLAWSPAAADLAQARARTLAAAGGGLSHDPANRAYGENLAMMTNSAMTPLEAAERAASLWYAESALYDFARPGYSASAGHFTQLVWRSTRLFGAAVAPSADGLWLYVAFEFYPPGNVDAPGEFAANVGAFKA